MAEPLLRAEHLGISFRGLRALDDVNFSIPQGAVMGLIGPNGAGKTTLFNLLIGLDGYTVSSGILSEDLNGTDIVAVPLESDEEMQVGLLRLAGRPLSPVAARYVEHLRAYLAAV